MGLEAIEKEAFKDCKSLTRIAIPESITDIPEGAFDDCESMTSIVLPNNLRSIGRFAFRNCSSLEVITIPAKVEVIRECAFAGCNRMRFVCALGSEPAQLNGNPFPAALRTIFVPRSDVRAYKTAWMSYAMFIRGNKE
jgi:hypothetical protein